MLRKGKSGARWLRICDFQALCEGYTAARGRRVMAPASISDR
jgi:hypothetical protein